MMPGLPSSEMQAPRPCPAPSGHPGSQGLCEFGAQVRGVWHSGAEASYFIAEPCEGRGSGGCTEVVRRVGLGRRRGEDKLQKGRGGGRGLGGAATLTHMHSGRSRPAPEARMPFLLSQREPHSTAQEPSVQRRSGAKAVCVCVCVFFGGHN